MLSSGDLKEVVNRLTGEDNRLEEEMMQQLIDNVSLLPCQLTPFFCVTRMIIKNKAYSVYETK
jgi:hypothetical protein